MMKRFTGFAAACLCLAGWGCNARTQDFKSLDNATFAAAIKDTAVQVLDVRTPAEYAEGHIPGALNIDVLGDGFESKCQKALDKERTVAVYCRSGKRSKKAAEILTGKGFDIIELNTGFSGWNGPRTVPEE